MIRRRPAISKVVDELWATYKADPTRPVRDQLIDQYLPLVRYVASRVAAGLPQSVEQSDLASYGVFGLIDAIDKFDLERGIKFETYAMARIHGAIIDELRSIDWVPRSVRAKVRSIENAHAKLEGELHRAPTEHEVATEMELNGDQFRAAVTQLSHVGLVALDEVLSLSDRGESITFGDTIADTHQGPVGAYEVEEMRLKLADAIEHMPQRERTVLLLYYYVGRTLADIGVILGVTESRVCQIHTKAILQVCGKCLDGDNAIPN